MVGALLRRSGCPPPRLHLVYHGVPLSLGFERPKLLLVHGGQGLALPQAQEHRRVRGGRTGAENVERREAQCLPLGRESKAAVQRGAHTTKCRKCKCIDFNTIQYNDDIRVPTRK